MPILIPTHVNNNNTAAYGYKLFDVYPNPFNPSAVIKYEVPKAVYVYLRIYDILGREISIIDEGVKQLGKHEVIFNGANLSSGVYFAVIEAEGYIDSKKFILLK
jgi:hypothetical protein